MERQNPFPPALDGLSAWQNAARMVTANREMLMAIAGVFFMLPALLFAVMVPQPDLPQGLTGKAAFEALSDYYGAASPYLLVVTVLQLAGMLAEVTGFRGRLVFDSSKPDGTPRKLMDVSRLAAMGWRARTGLREGIEGTYRWFLANADGLREA